MGNVLKEYHAPYKLKTSVLPILFQYCYKYYYSDRRNIWAVMTAGGLAL
jgi:hypothetical protein